MNNNLNCPRESKDCKMLLNNGSTIINTNVPKVRITNVVLSNPVADITCTLECETCNKKWKGVLKNGVTTYEKLK